VDGSSPDGLRVIDHLLQCRFKRVKSSSVTVSVTATPGPFLSAADRDRDAQRHSAEHAALGQRMTAGRFNRELDGNSLKKLSLTRSTPGGRKPAGDVYRLAWFIVAIAAALFAKQVMWREKASAHSTELVQMFDVAFSRRICCSRVERVSTSRACPQHRPSRRKPSRHLRTYFSRCEQGKKKNTQKNPT
jgi:hypothetical protein